MTQGATAENTDKARRDLKARLVSIHKRCVDLRGHERATKGDKVRWPRDLNAPNASSSWGPDPEEEIREREPDRQGQDPTIERLAETIERLAEIDDRLRSQSRPR